MKKRFITLDVVKFFSMFIVFLFHFFVEGQLNLNIDFSKIIYHLSNGIVSIGVSANTLFFMISGFVLSIGYDSNIKNFYIKKIVRILIPYYILYIILYIKNAFFLKKIFLFNFSELPRIIFTIFGIDTYLSSIGVKTLSFGIGEWFLGCIIIYYFLFPLLYKVKIKNIKICFLLFVLYCIFTNYYVFKTPINQNIFINIFNFYFGILIYKFYKNSIDEKQKIKKNYKKKFIMLIVLGIFIIIFNKVIYYIIRFFTKSYELIKVDNILNPMIISTCFSIVIILISIFWESEKEKTFDQTNLKIFLSWFNKYFYNIFLVHHIVIIIVIRQFIKINNSYNLVDKYNINIIIFLIFFFCIFITVFFAIILNMIEKALIILNKKIFCKKNLR